MFLDFYPGRRSITAIILFFFKSRLNFVFVSFGDEASFFCSLSFLVRPLLNFAFHLSSCFSFVSFADEACFLFPLVSCAPPSPFIYFFIPTPLTTGDIVQLATTGKKIYFIISAIPDARKRNDQASIIHLIVIKKRRRG